MIRPKLKFLVLVTGLLLSYTHCLAHFDYEERKEVNKMYTITSSTSVSFTNSFGKMQVNTWDKNQLQVNIEIITRASNESRAKDMLDRITIDIDDSNPSSRIAYRTQISNMKNSGNSSMEINYTVYMPKDNPLYLKNSFGDCFLDQYNGKLDLNESYGNLNTGELNGESDIDLSFGSGTSKIAAMKSGEVKVSYSTMDMGSVGSADINSQFSALSVDKLSDATLVAKYGKIELGEVGSIDGNVHFSSFGIDRLNKMLKLDIEYGGQTSIDNISREIQSLTINSSFGPVRLDLPSGLNASLDVKVEFGNFHYDKGSIDFNKIYEGNTSKEYHGKIGSGSGSVNISVTAKYGDVRINED